MARWWLAATVGAVLLALPADARRTQAQLTATFKDRDRVAARTPAPPVLCAVDFELADERASPEIAGVIGRRGVLAPADARTWLRAVLGGLAARGVAAGFEPSPPARPVVRLTLQTAWIASTPSTYSANVVLRLEVPDRGRAATRVYRGRESRTAFWSGGEDTLQSAIDGAFADALDTMAPELAKLCR